jgi:hypothetical protein
MGNHSQPPDNPLAPSALTGGATADKNNRPWKIIIADDEPEVHRITEMVLFNYEFEGKPLQFLSAHGPEIRSVP